jgi:hypothetical protein
MLDSGLLKPWVVAKIVEDWGASVPGLVLWSAVWPSLEGLRLMIEITAIK